MPGFTTHYLFGFTTYRKLNTSPMRTCIRKHPHAYALGLQGPDIFFYYPPSHMRASGNLGSLAHKNRTGAFLCNLLKSRSLFPNSPDKNIAASYIAGFLGHYVLDTICHPYVYAKSHYHTFTRGYFSHHIYLETDIDTELLAYYKNCAPSEFHSEDTIRLSRHERHVIASLLHYAYSRTYPEYHFVRLSVSAAIRSMRLGVTLLRDPSGFKKAFVRKVEAKTIGYAGISPLIPSDVYTFTADPLNLRHFRWRNPWDITQCSNASFFDLLDKARAEYTSVLTLTEQFFSATPQTLLYRKRLADLSAALGNKSYGSGLPLT